MALRRPRQRLRPIYEFMRLLMGDRQGFTDGEASFQIIHNWRLANMPAAFCSNVGVATKISSADGNSFRYYAITLPSGFAYA